MEGAKDNIIRIEKLSKHYGGVVALDNVSFEVKKGEIFGFIGHNGAGKTTLVNILTTLLLPTSGTAKVAGFDIIRDGVEVRRRIGYLPENVQLYGNLSAYENLVYFAKLSGLNNPRSRIDEVLRFLNGDYFKDKKISECSKGMRQKIGIAQAIIHKPQVLFLDEPTSGLDPQGVKQLRDILLLLNKETGMTIFMNTHLLSEVTQTCTSLGILSHGKLIYTDSLRNTLKKYNSEESLEQIYLSIEKGNDGHA